VSLWSFFFGPSAVDVLQSEVSHLRKENDQLRDTLLRMADKAAYADVHQMRWFSKEHSQRLSEDAQRGPAPPEAPADPMERAGPYGPHLAAQGHFERDPTPDELEAEDERDRQERIREEKMQVQREAMDRERELVAQGEGRG